MSEDMMSKSFAEEFEKACRRLGNTALKDDVQRVHQEAVRDNTHAFRNVDITKPDPWRSGHWTGPTL